MIRALKPEEFEHAAELGKRFVEEAKLPFNVVPEVFAANWRKLYAASAGVILGSYEGESLVGGIGLILHPDICDGVLQAQEAFWWVNPESRGSHGIRLLAAGEDWAMEHGARRILMAHMESINADVLPKVYNRRGYRKVESFFVKEI